MWDAALAGLREVEEQMRKLMEEFERNKQEEEALKLKKEDCLKKVERADQLITKLADENEMWKVDVVKKKEFRENIVGDIIVCSGIVAYLGVFTENYRVDCVKNWIDMLREFEIKSSPEVAIQPIMGNPVKIRQWVIDKLPQDKFSIDNAIIMNNSDRWPLMIDPQMQANIWIKTMEVKNQVKFIKPTMDPKLISRTLENTIPFGYPVILEDAGENFDPLLEPLMSKQIEKKGSMYNIRVGETSLEYDPNFRFYITTKLSRPHFAPEVCVKVTMLNFMVT